MTEQPFQRIENLVRQIEDALAGQAMNEDIRRNLRALVQAWLARLDVIPRDEFDAQKAVLAQTCQRLQTLEAELERLDTELAQRGH